MIDNYKKGDIILLTYTVNGEKFCSTGVILDRSCPILTVGHNFKDTSPIDITYIQIKDILESKNVLPKEINSFDDLGV